MEVENKGVQIAYVQVIKKMYKWKRLLGCAGDTITKATITIELSLYLFVLVMDKLTKHIQEKASWCTLFVDNIVLVDKTNENMNNKLEL